MQIPLLISTLAVIITLLYASYLDILDRRVPFRTWYPMLVVGVPCVAVWYGVLFLTGYYLQVTVFLALTLIFSCLFYGMAAARLFGGADAWALIFLSACIPAYPFLPLLWADGVSPLGFFPFSVLVNAVLINLIAPVGIFLKNIIEKNQAPIPYLFLGFPVQGDRIEKSFGFVIEEVIDVDGALTRRFPPFHELLIGLIRGKRRIYTRDLRENPEEYAEEISLFRRAGTVWISYGVPFIVPITAGLLTALMVGDVLYLVMRSIAGF
ncbi:MAG: prepilin peptidase [Methanomicrobiales archaeon]|nr:prepilin peptidase [Methanomicrobiales archaeon]